MPEKHTEIIARGVCCVAGRLLVCRNIQANRCYLPGGHVEFDEPAAAALAREMIEEAGTPIQVGPFLGAIEAAFNQIHRAQSSNPERRRHHEVSLLFSFKLEGVRTSSRSNAGKPPLVISREEDLKFIWANAADLKGPRPRVKLLPPACLPIVLAAIRQGTARSAKPRTRPAIWAQEWE